jgi:hypothetical protein
MWILQVAEADHLHALWRTNAVSGCGGHSKVSSSPDVKVAAGIYLSQALLV